VFNNGGAFASQSATLSAFHTLQGVADITGGQSYAFVDGVKGTLGGTAGSGTMTSISIGTDVPGEFLNGFVCEAGLWPSKTLSVGDNTAMESNVTGYWHAH
jgi:hypothetical protein